MDKEVSWSSVLFDRIIGVKFTVGGTMPAREYYDLSNTRLDEEDEEAEFRNEKAQEYEIDIDIPANEHGGMKPDISFSASLLPGEMFHEVTLTIKNYKLPFDIRRYKRMVILAGYRKQTREGGKYDETIIRRFPIEIFYSYCLTPAPDSSTVFKGIIVSNFTDNSVKDYFSSDTNYVMTFYDDITVEEYINHVVNMLNNAGYSISLKNNIPDYIKKVKMKTGPATKDSYYGQRRFQSVPHMIRSIVAMLEEAYKYRGKTTGSFNVHFEDGVLNISCTDGYYSKSEGVIILDHISSATLNAGIMNVTAPWYPPVTPGNIIYVERKYIDGSDLPNVINVDELMGKDNLYRVLTMDIEFASVSSSNSMKITAIPLKYSEDDTSYNIEGSQDEYKEKFEVIKDAADKKLEQIKENSSWNTKNKIDKIPLVSYVVGEIKEEDNPVFQYVREHTSMFASFTLPSSDIMKKDYKISELCRKVYYKNFPSMVIPWSQITVPAVWLFKDKVDYDSSWLWPVVYAATYYRYLQNKKNLNNESVPDALNPFTMKVNTCNVAVAGQRLSYPVLNNWTDIKGSVFAGLYKAASTLANLSANKIASYGSVASNLFNIGTILELL